MIIRVENIPNELQGPSQWVGWQYKEDRDGKSTKVPVYSHNGRTHHASVSDPATWTSFEDAITKAEENGWDGVGFVVTENDDRVGIDIDDCIDSDGNLSRQAIEIISTLNSYTEKSPSGNGIRIFIQGELPDGTGNRRDGLEIYDRGRYLTVTGNVIRNRPIEHRQEQLEQICEKYLKPRETERPLPELLASPHDLPDDEVINLLQREQPGKGSRLFNGDTGEHDSHSEADQALCFKIAFYTKDPHQIDRIFRRSGLYREKWERDDYRRRTIEKALRTVRDQYERSQRQGESTSEPTTEQNEGNTYELTELGDACRVVDKHGKDLLHTMDTKKWYRWTDGPIWTPANDIEIQNLVADEMEALILDPGVEDDSQRQAVRKHAIKNQSNYKLETIEKVLRRIAYNRPHGVIDVPLTKDRRVGVPIDSSVLDENLDLTGTPNGPVDLRTGELLPPRREYLITKSTSVPPDSSIGIPLWLDLLEFVCNVPGGGSELMDWIQKMCGYFLTGRCTEQVFFLLWGRGWNGKSTFVEAISNILGDYTQGISATTLMSSRHQKAGEPRSDLVKLKGARLMPSIETGQFGQLDETLVKSLTGGDLIVARALYQEETQFRMQGKLILATNNKPTIREFTPAMWRRVRLIPFTNTIAEEDRIPDYGELLKEEYPGILAWMLEGARRWYEEGLGIHPVVTQATADYADEMDNLAPFFEECCEIDLTQNEWFEPIGRLYQRYEEWCSSIGLEPVVKANGFSRYITQKYGLENKRMRGYGRVRVGIRLTDTEQADEIL